MSPSLPPGASAPGPGGAGVASPAGTARATIGLADAVGGAPLRVRLAWPGLRAGLAGTAGSSVAASTSISIVSRGPLPMRLGGARR
jgi:hypothetical protein